ncbi:putative hydroxypyruvate isomerase [Styela clava]
MAKLNFSCNISWLFRESEFTERFQLAADHGFKAVELGWPYSVKIEKLVAAKESAGVELILMNTGSIQSLGSAAVPGSEEDFKQELDLAIQYAKALKCKRIHIMAGQLPDDCTKYIDEDHKAQYYPEYTKTFIANLQYASEKLMAEGMTGLIEPINCRKDVPRYFLTTHEQACSILDQVGRPNIKYQLDFYHLQLMEGNLTANLKRLLPRIGHIQISQVPSRAEPSSPGEINYDYIFNLLESLCYRDWIGCEYAPSKNTDNSLKWFKEYLEAADHDMVLHNRH